MLATQQQAAPTTTPSASATTTQHITTHEQKTPSLKMERRDSTTSESSLEHLDLGRTPKKLNSHTSATSTPHVAANGGVEKTKELTTQHNAIESDSQMKQEILRLPPPHRLHDSDEANDYDESAESADEKPQLSAQRAQRHHKRRNCVRLDKRTPSVQLEYNADNPNSLRKKFRFNHNVSETANNTNSNNNESGFVDASYNSQLLNASTASAIATAAISAATAIQPQVSPLTSATPSNTSSAASSPHGAGGSSGGNVMGGGVSSPESGIGEREDMKYVCPICEVVSATPHEFTNHIRCHNYSSGDTENFTCRICSKVLSSASSLDRHVLVHTGERPFNCKYCHLTFTTNGNMHRHMRTHKQHQHNHHHRRNSNGTKNNNNNNNSNNANKNNNNTTNTTATAHVTPVTNISAVANAQLTNGISVEGVKTASATISTTATTAATGANGKCTNGNSAVESYESDGGCSTDSSSAISQSSNNHTNNKNTSSNNNNNNNLKNSNNSNNTNNNKIKRKNSEHLDVDDITLMKRRVKTTINNNNIIAASDENQLALTVNNNNDLISIAAHNNTISPTHNTDAMDDVDAAAVEAHTLICPACNAADFDSMLSLGAHMDLAHADIPAKCRHCDVVFCTHRQLNVHPCTQKPNVPAPPPPPTAGLNDLTAFVQMAKSLFKQNMRNGIPDSRIDCSVCLRSYPNIDAWGHHIGECQSEAIKRFKLSEDCATQPNLAAAFRDLTTYAALSLGGCDIGKQQRRMSEGSADATIEDAIAADDEEVSEQDQREREEYLRNNYLKNKSTRPSSRNSLSSEHHSTTDDQFDDIKFEVDGERTSSQNPLSQQSQESKDLADIQSILNMTSSSSTSNFLKNFEQSVNTPSSNYSFDKDEEEAQDAFTSEFRKMKLRGEFPCKLCTAVFPNLRALKGHNRIHLSAAGPAGPFRCNMCPYSICDKAALVRHMRTHNGDRPYECAVCNYAFTTKANCERHLRNRHAKATRDEIKRAIIYHPSEDSSCDDPAKKLHMFSSPDFDDDMDLSYQQPPPKDRSTPVSHLKEMLMGDSPSAKPLKIQVKSLEKLLDKPSSSNAGYGDGYDQPTIGVRDHPETAPIDLSMDVLDLSKKPNNKPLENEINETRAPTPPAVQMPVEMNNNNTLFNAPAAEDPIAKFDLANLEKNHQLFLAQQQFMSDPANYLQQFYRNLVFPPIHPLFLQNSFMPNNLNDLQKFAPLMSRMFGGGVPTASPLPNLDANKSTANSTPSPAPGMIPQASPLMSEKSMTPTLASNSPVTSMGGQQLPKSLSSPTLSNVSLSIPRHSHISPTLLPGGPVKMVIKNGVLMPKQKQRRYRTERPFACEHCSARFTLRSNMERHVKQQHPQFYAQRQRSGHHIMRGRGASSAAAMNNITHLQAAFAQAHNNGGTSMHSSPISEQVKYAILAQQLKARKDTDLLQQALAHGSSSIAPNHMLLNAPTAGLSQLPNGQPFNFSHMSNSNASGGAIEDDEPKLIIDEDDDDDDDIEEIPDNNEDEEEEEEDEDQRQNGDLPPEPQKQRERIQEQMAVDANDNTAETVIPKTVEEVKTDATETKIDAAKKVADSILEQAIKAGQKLTSAKSETQVATPAPPATNSALKSMIAQAGSVGKNLKEVASSPFKDESQDLVPVSKLVDNATSNSVSFNNYFRPSDVANHMEQSDEEGLVASGSASESNNSGTEDIATSVESKKKSAYSLAPNRVSCPYCQRMFPWTSSLRRHILTHTGQKPFKCSHCPLLFTTKSNCDRHLLRKHGDVESAVSVYVPTEDVNEPIPVPKSVEEIEHQQRQRDEEERKRKAQEMKLERDRREKEQRKLHREEQQQQQQQQQQLLLKQIAAAAQFNQLNGLTPATVSGNAKLETNAVSSTDLPYKCHLCESSFAERVLCLEHIRNQHDQEFALLLAKGAIDTEADANQQHAAAVEDEEHRASEEAVGVTGRGGKYPDYSNRKVICAFCVRRFWSTEDLRRHMRTHSGERPFQCEICLRKFTLKHSMLRHMKKHNGRHHNGTSGGELDSSAAGNSGSDFSDDEQTTPVTGPAAPLPISAALFNLRAPKIQELLNKANEWRANGARLTTATLGEHKENIADEHNNQQSDLIGNLLGISDQGILNKLLSSADEAAKLLGVEK